MYDTVCFLSFLLLGYHGAYTLLLHVHIVYNVRGRINNIQLPHSQSRFTTKLQQASPTCYSPVIMIHGTYYLTHINNKLK